MNWTNNIPIPLDHIEEGLFLTITSKNGDTIANAEDSFLDNNEAQYQIIEGHSYDYVFNKEYYSLNCPLEKSIVVSHSSVKHLGSINPNIYVGTLSLEIRNEIGDKYPLNIEIQSIKTDYRNDYRKMLEYITEQCNDLLYSSSSPVSHSFSPDSQLDSRSLYQRFTFVKSVIDSETFSEAINKILESPVTSWKEIESQQDIRKVRRFGIHESRQLVKGKKQINLPKDHFLRKKGIQAISDRIEVKAKSDTIDTPENRFIKHALNAFILFCNDIANNRKANVILTKEANLLIEKLEDTLSHEFFKDIQQPITLKLNSPVLQKKEGYREVLRVWLLFDLAAKLVWEGGEDVYRSGKRDVAKLYEYWLYFKLLELVKKIFKISAKKVDELIEETNDGLSLKLKEGNHIPIKGVYDAGSRKLNIQLSYNRNFQGSSKEFSYPKKGSWTSSLRPDYTLTIWPFGINTEQAEKEEVIVHVHFDAKYKVANLSHLFEKKEQSELSAEKEEHRKGLYKRADLLKMHAYKDAIRRTGGAYVLYPGDTVYRRSGFHEIIPGLGAFNISPSNNNDGLESLEQFIRELTNHFLNRTSQFEKSALAKYTIHKEKQKEEDKFRESAPELYGKYRDLIPDETFVLVGFIRSPQHFEWIKAKKLYNFRIDSQKGSLSLDYQTVSSKFLLLHGKGDKSSSKLYRITSNGPKFYSKAEMEGMKYPFGKNRKSNGYLIVKIEEIGIEEFADSNWDFKSLPNYRNFRKSGLPFTASLAELMKVRL